MGASFFDLIHPDDRERTIAEAAALMVEGHRVPKFENRYRTRQGGYRDIDWTAVSDGQFIHALGRDNTDEKAHADALALAESAMRQAQKMEAIGQLTGGVAHDFTYIDIGMDLAGEPPDFRIFGQVVLSSPGRPCLRCMGVVTERMLEQEERARQYGEAGSKPQVIWPNGVLASTAVGLLMQLVTPWHARPVESAHLEYDGNSHTLRHAPRLKVILERAIPCTHYLAHEVGDPFFGTALDRARRQSSAPANE